MNMYSCLLRDSEKPHAPIKEIQVKALNTNYARIAVDTNYPDYKLIQTPKFLHSATV